MTETLKPYLVDTANWTDRYKCPNCGDPRDHPALRFCAKCRRVAL